MNKYRIKDTKGIVTVLFCDKQIEELDPWLVLISDVKGSNRNRKKMFQPNSGRFLISQCLICSHRKPMQETLTKSLSWR